MFVCLFTDSEGSEELQRHPCVFGGDDLNLAEDLPSAGAQVGEVPDRRRDEEQSSRRYGCSSAMLMKMRPVPW